MFVFLAPSFSQLPFYWIVLACAGEGAKQKWAKFPFHLVCHLKFNNMLCAYRLLELLCQKMYSGVTFRGDRKTFPHEGVFKMAATLVSWTR